MSLRPTPPPPAPDTVTAGLAPAPGPATALPAGLARPAVTRHVIQGEFAVCDRPETVLSTVLGSCVTACLHDPVRGIGGINHFLLPGSGKEPDDVKFGACAMERLINALLRRGAERGRLRAKLFGGARLMDGLPDIGQRNQRFALWFLETEQIPCMAHSLGGTRARRLRFWPHEGRAQQMLVDMPLEEPRPPRPAGGEVTMF